MKSFTKTALSPGDLSAAARRAFGPGAEVTGSQEITEGWFNTIYALDLAEGRRINSLRSNHFGSILPGGRRSGRWSETVLGLVADVLDDGRDRGTVLPWAGERILGLVEDHRAVLDEVTEPRLVHWDLHDGNAFLEGNKVVGIIDADRALWGDPLMEVYFGTLYDRTGFATGYGSPIHEEPGATPKTTGPGLRTSWSVSWTGASDPAEDAS